MGRRTVAAAALCISILSPARSASKLDTRKIDAARAAIHIR
jgi:hypothetical protein